jgi:hypothetical protein
MFPFLARDPSLLCWRVARAAGLTVRLSSLANIVTVPHSIAPPKLRRCFLSDPFIAVRLLWNPVDNRRLWGDT